MIIIITIYSSPGFDSEQLFLLCFSLFLNIKIDYCGLIITMIIIFMRVFKL